MSSLHVNNKKIKWNFPSDFDFKTVIIGIPATEVSTEGTLWFAITDTTESVHSEGIWAVMAYFQMNGKVIISARAQYDEFGLNPYRVRCVKN